MERKIISLLLFIIIVFLFHIKNTFAAGFIYDESNDLIYIGGFPIENERLSFDSKIDKLPLLYKIYSIKLKNQEEHTIFEANNKKIMTYSISNKGFIAISTHKVNEQKGINEKQLFIMNKEGKIIKIIEDVMNIINKGYFSWSPDGQQIVYVTGKSIIEGHYPFESQGVFIYDIVKDEIVKIADKGTDVKWSGYDNNIYIMNKFIYEDPQDISIYNTTKKQLMKSERRGIIFSDDGKFYIGAEIDKNFEGEGNQLIYYIYNNLTNEKIYHFTGEEGYSVEVASEIFFIKGTHCLVIRYSSLYFIFDLDKKKTIKKLNMGLIGFNKDMTKGVVYEGGGKFVNIVFLMEGIKIKSVEIPPN
jgi:Tol biopolymer transport system component